MHEVNIFEGKTTNEAIEKGLRELRVSKNDVEIKVIDEEKRSFFDILAPRVVKIEMKLKENKENINKDESKQKDKINTEINIDKKVLENSKSKIVEFLDNFFKQTVGEKVEYISNIKENIIEIIVNDKKANFLIGYRGETLNALQVILSSIAVKEYSEKVKVELDILGYREKRKKALEELAEKIAKSVVRTKKSITLEPMTPYERKIIHAKLQDSNKVKTVSVGEGSHRKIIVLLK